jgi:serine/threonine protein kinase
MPEKGMNKVIGTLLYMAPEILRRKNYDTKSDMWSVGVILYIMLAGRIPWKQTDQKLLYAEIEKGDYSLGGK